MADSSRMSPSLKSPSPLCRPKLDEIYLRSADSRRSSGGSQSLREPPSPLPMASPRPGASLATADRRGVHALERLGEALDAALSTGVAFVLLLWAKRSVFYEVLIRVVRLLLFVALLIPGSRRRRTTSTAPASAAACGTAPPPATSSTSIRRTSRRTRRLRTAFRRFSLCAAARG